MALGWCTDYTILVQTDLLKMKMGFINKRHTEFSLEKYLYLQLSPVLQKENTSGQLKWNNRKYTSWD